MKDKQITLAEFRAWLEGIEELQTTSWFPTGPQWKRIRKKIDLIIEQKPQTVVQYGPQATSQTHQLPRQQHFEAPSNTSLLPPSDAQVPSDLTQAQTHHQQAPVGRLNVQGGRIKTPNIDTSDGSYVAPFA